MSAGPFKCKAATVARPVAVRPLICTKSVRQAKWRDRRWRRGLNRGTIRPVCGSRDRVLSYLWPLHAGHAQASSSAAPPRRAPGAGRAHRRKGRTNSWRDAGSTRNGPRRGRGPVARPHAGSPHAPSRLPSPLIPPFADRADFPRRRPSSARASARAASSRWTSWARAWYSASSSGVKRPRSLRAISLFRRRAAAAGRRALAARTKVASSDSSFPSSNCRQARRRPELAPLCRREAIDRFEALLHAERVRC